MFIEKKLSQATEYFNRAYKSHMDGEIEDAIEDYKNSIDIFPTAKAYTFLGWAYSLLGKFEEAIVECKNAITVDSLYSNPYYDIGLYFLNLNNFDEAGTWFEKAIDLVEYEPKFLPYYQLGRVYEKKGDWIQALAFYKNALLLNHDFEPAQNSVIKITTLLN